MDIGPVLCCAVLCCAVLYIGAEWQGLTYYCSACESLTVVSNPKDSLEQLPTQKTENVHYCLLTYLHHGAEFFLRS
jgi:hypothetical protein